MKKPTILILGLLFLLNFHVAFGQTPDYLKSATATGTGTTTDNSTDWSDVVSVTIDLGENNDDTKFVLVTASINMRPDGSNTNGREANYNIYRSDAPTDESGIIKRQMISNDETGVESWGIGTLVHIFDVSSLSGDVTYILQHSNQGNSESERNVFSSARLTAVALSTAINHYELSNDVKRIDDTDAVTTTSADYDPVTGLTTDAITLPVKGGIYVAASINGRMSTNNATTAEYKLQYSDDGGTSWADLGKPVKRSMYNSYDDGIVSLVGLLQNQDPGTNYKFRVAHKRVSGISEVTTHYCNLVAIALAHDYGYFPSIYSEVGDEGKTIIGVSADPTTVTSSEFTSALDIGGTGPSLFVNSQYLVSASGLSESPSPVQRMRAGNKLFVNDAASGVVSEEEYYRFISSNSSFGAGGYIGLMEDLDANSLYTVGMNHEVNYVSNPDADDTDDETLKTSSVILTGFQTYDQNLAPAIQCNAQDIYLGEDGTYILSPAEIRAFAAGTTDDVDDFDDLDITVSRRGFNCSQVGEDLDAKVIVTDQAGNQSSCWADITVYPPAAYKIDTVADVEVVAAAGECGTTITYPDFINDNCAPFTQIEGLGPDSLFPIGTTTESWVADINGNKDTVSFDVIVTSTNAVPTLDSVADVDATEDATINVELTGISAGNDCAEQEVIITADSSNADLIASLNVDYTSGDTTATLAVTLVPEASDTAEITVTVEDDMGAMVSRTFTLAVSAVNDAPYLIAPIPDQTINASYILKVPVSPILGEIFGDNDSDSITLALMEEGMDALPGWATFASDTLLCQPMIADTGCVNIVVTASDGELTAADTFQVCVEGYPTAITDLGAGQFEVNLYPNPTKGMVNVDIQSAAISDIELTVLNITGKQVLRKQYRAAERITFDMSDRVSGMYFVKLDFEGKQVLKKLIVRSLP